MRLSRESKCPIGLSNSQKYDRKPQPQAQGGDAPGHGKFFHNYNLALSLSKSKADVGHLLEFFAFSAALPIAMIIPDASIQRNNMNCGPESNHSHASE
jgi:hypothetical protein